jgi:hypothetical protein
MDWVVAPLFHKNVPPGMLGVAVSVVEFPSQMVSLFTVTVATGLTVIVPVALFETQPAPLT